MTNALVNFRKICSLPLVWLVSLEASLNNELKKGFFRQNHWRFSRKAKCLTVVAIVAVLLISVFAFLPKQSVSRGNVIPLNSDNSSCDLIALLLQIGVTRPRFLIIALSLSDIDGRCGSRYWFLSILLA